MESSTSVLERLLAQSESDFSAIPGGKKEVIFMHVSGMLDTGALQILRRKETTEDSGKMTRPELLEWLRTQDLGTPTMIQSAREAQTLADDVLRQHREDEAQKNRDAAATFNGREQEVQRARHRESLIGKRYPNSEPVGIRIPVKKNGKTYYELVDPAGVGVNEGFLTTGTPTSGPEKNKCTVAKVASHFGLDADWLLKINQEVYTNLGGVEEQFKAEHSSGSRRTRSRSHRWSGHPCSRRRFSCFERRSDCSRRPINPSRWTHAPVAGLMTLRRWSARLSTESGWTWTRLSRNGSAWASSARRGRAMTRSRRA